MGKNTIPVQQQALYLWVSPTISRFHFSLSALSGAADRDDSIDKLSVVHQTNPALCCITTLLLQQFYFQNPVNAKSPVFLPLQAKSLHAQIQRALKFKLSHIPGPHRAP